MRIIVGHSNMDLDCLGSLALARVLFPEYRAVRGRLIHPVARRLYNLYADHLDLASIDERPREPVEKVVIVDTRSRGRLREFERLLGPSPGRFLRHRRGGPAWKRRACRIPVRRLTRRRLPS